MVPPPPWMPYKRQHSALYAEEAINPMMNTQKQALYAETAENATIGPMPADKKKKMIKEHSDTRKI